MENQANAFARKGRGVDSFRRTTRRGTRQKQADSVLGAVLPPLIIISVISSAYAAFRDNAIVSACLKGMQSGVAAVIADVVFGMGGKIVKAKSAFQIGLMIAAFAATWFFGVNVVFIILFCGVLSAAKTLLAGRKGGGDHAA